MSGDEQAPDIRDVQNEVDPEENKSGSEEDAMSDQNGNGSENGNSQGNENELMEMDDSDSDNDELAQIPLFELDLHTDSVCSVAFHPSDSSILASGGLDDKAFVRIGNEITELTMHSDTVI
jgi:WD40 repeat protein